MTNESTKTDAERASVVKMQAFVRGALCRARVSLMVQKLIDELLAQRYGQRGDSAQNNGGRRTDVNDYKGNTEARIDSNVPLRSPPQSPVKTSPFLKKKPSAAALFSQAKSSSQQELPVSPYSPTRRKKTIDPNLQHNATRHVTSSLEILSQHGERVDAEMSQLLKDIYRIGEPGQPTVTFGELFDDDQVANYYEALVGTLKAARKKGLIKYDGQVLLKGINDDVVISIVR